MGSPPSAPNPSQGIALGQEVAGQQQQFNTTAGQQSQSGSMIGQNNPVGSLSYQHTGTDAFGNPTYTANTSLTPQQEALFQQYQATQFGAGNQGANLLAGANYGSQSPSTAIGNMTSGLTGQMMNNWQSATQPFFTTQTQQLDTQLRNQGLFPGSPGYDNAMRSLTTNQGYAAEGAAAQFQPTAFGEATNLFQMPATLGTSLASFGAGNAAGTGQNLVNTPGLSIQPANLTGATATEQQALNQQYQAQMDQYNGLMKGIFGVGGTVLGTALGGPAGGALGGSLGGAMSGLFGGSQPSGGMFSTPSGTVIGGYTYPTAT